MLNTPEMTQIEMSMKLGVSRRTLQRKIDYLKSINMIERLGNRKTGKWIISQNYSEIAEKSVNQSGNEVINEQIG